MKQPLTLCTLAFALALPACKPQTPVATTAAPAPAATANAHAFQPAINADDFAAHVKTLASDDFEGRAPGSAGEDKSVAYLQAQFQRLGLKPVNGDSYFQTVPMVETTADENVALKLD